MGEKHVILIVDDTPENLRVLGEVLEQEGYEVMVATNGPDALVNAAADPAPDLILLDIMIPEMDGYEVCRRLKANEATRDIPVVFLTARTSSDDEAQGLELGAVDYIMKPFKLELVKARVMNHIALRQAQLALQRYNIRLEDKVLERTIKLAEANERLKLLDSAKSDFLHCISHELRTPANGVLTVGQLAIYSIEDSSVRDEVQSLFNSSSDRLIETLNNSLQLTEISLGESQQTAERIDLEKILLTAKVAVKEIADKKSLSFRVYSASPGSAMGNEKLFQQALTAILHALILIADPGTCIAVEYKDVGDMVGMILGAHGKTLPEDELNTFFELFSGRRSTSHVQSLGFAIPLSAKIIKTMGGRIDIRNSKEGVEVLIHMQKYADIF
jgi:DNA-binding response OmpR family regulator